MNVLVLPEREHKLAAHTQKYLVYSCLILSR